MSPRPRRRRRGLAALLFAVALVSGGVGAYFLIPGLATSGGGGNPAGSTGAPLRLIAAQDFDPLGNDGEENHRLVANAIDGNLQTTWPTEIYNTRDFGHAKPGVGIYVTLARSATISTVTVDTVESGWNAQIYTTASDQHPPTTLGGWGKPVAAGAHLSNRAQFTVPSGTQARVVLLWITYLPDGGKLDVAEIQVR